MAESIPIACSLPLGAREDRRLTFAALAEGAEARERTGRGLRLRFREPQGFQADVADLIRQEKECCPFLDFRIQATGGELLLDIAAPAEAWPIIEDLFGASDSAP
jgi:MerR family copper efflux transcriptional regulator